MLQDFTAKSLSIKMYIHQFEVIETPRDTNHLLTLIKQLEALLFLGVTTLLHQTVTSHNETPSKHLNYLTQNGFSVR